MATSNPDINWNVTPGTYAGPVLSKINVAGTEYWLKDAEAREKIDMLHNVAAMHFIGVALLDPTDGDENPYKLEVGYFPAYVATSDHEAICYYYGELPTTPSITSNGVTYTVIDNVVLSAGDVFIYKDAEYVFSTSDEQFHRLGTTGSFKGFAYADLGRFTYTPKGDVTVEVTPTKDTPIVNVNQGSVSASGKFTPAGTVSIAAGSTESVINSVSTKDKYLSYSEIATGVKPTTTTLKTSNIHTDISKTQKVLETKLVRQAGADVAVPNVTANTEVKIPNVTGNTTVMATYVREKAETAKVAAIGEQITAVKSITAPSSVVTSVTGKFVTEVTDGQKAEKVGASVTGETLVLSSSEVLTGISSSKADIQVSTDSISHNSVSFNPTAKTAVEITEYELHDVEASKVTLGTQLTATNTTLGTALNVAGAGSDVTLASGKIADADKNGATIVTDVSTAGEMAVVTGLTTGTSVVTGVSADSKTFVVTGLAESGKDGDKVVADVQSGSTTVMKSVGAATFTGTEGTVNVSGSTSGVSATIDKEFVTDVTASATFAGTTETVDVYPVN